MGDDGNDCPSGSGIAAYAAGLGGRGGRRILAILSSAPKCGLWQAGVASGFDGVGSTDLVAPEAAGSLVVFFCEGWSIFPAAVCWSLCMFCIVSGRVCLARTFFSLQRAVFDQQDGLLR